jgi:hypothetical protein
MLVCASGGEGRPGFEVHWWGEYAAGPEAGGPHEDVAERSSGFARGR